MTAGRYLTWVCALFGHDEPLWSVRATGVGFHCPTCHRFRVSPVLMALARRPR